MKIYLEGDQFIIKDGSTTYSEYYEDISIVDAFNGNSSSPEYVYVKGVDGWDEKEVIHVLSTEDKDGIKYSLYTFNELIDKVGANYPEPTPTEDTPKQIVEDKIQKGVKGIAPSQDAVFQKVKELNDGKLDSDTIWIGTDTEYSQLETTDPEVLYFLKKTQ